MGGAQTVKGWSFRIRILPGSFSASIPFCSPYQCGVNIPEAGAAQNKQDTGERHF